MVTRPSITVRTRQTVCFEEGAQPYVGFEHLTDLPTGWFYDIKRWASPFDMRLPTLPRLLDPSSQGVKESEYFLSGVGSIDSGDLFVSSLSEITENYDRHWLPIVNHGAYFKFKTPYYYYSDNSIVQYIDPDENRSDRNYIELTHEPDGQSPICAMAFKRDALKQIDCTLRVNQNYSFSGIYIDGEEQETVSSLGKISWNNVDTTKREFIVDNTISGLTRLFFNKDYTKQIGVVPDVYVDLGACESLGASNGREYQAFYLANFPVLTDDFHLYIADSTSWEEWERVDSWWTLISASYSYGDNKKYYLDKDLGIVYFATAMSGVPVIGRTLQATYKRTVRIEYEALDRDMNVTAWDADVSPIMQCVNQGFICITHNVLEAAAITLEINKTKILGTSNPIEYGPVTVGSDYAILKATVTSPSGVAVHGTEVEFTMVPTTIGYLQDGDEAVGATNSAGEAYTVYQPPTSAETLGFYSLTVRDSTNPYYPGDREVIIKQNSPGLLGLEDEVYLFEVLKDDIIQAYETVDYFVYQLYLTDPPSWVIDLESYETWKAEMIEEWDLRDWEDPIEGDFIEGRKVVTYQISGVDNYDVAAINPVTNVLGAVVPVRPYLIEQITEPSDEYYGYWRLIYPAGSVPDCGPGKVVGGYWIISSRLVTFQAHCWSPFYNMDIYSNTITTRIELPSYLLGEYTNELGQKVPFGWKILSENDNIAAGLNGATFITVNPYCGPYPIIDIVGGTGETGDWADAPFRSISFSTFICTCGEDPCICPGYEP